MSDKRQSEGHPPDARIQLAHGEGGRLMRELISREILPRFGRVGDGRLEDANNGNDGRAAGDDAASLRPPGAELLFTTDSYVVSPLEFPGGDIGMLAVHGTVNDLAVAGGRPLWISLSLILEEGFPLTKLRRILESAATAASAAGVQVVTGDTKVVPRGAADQLFINTAGIGDTIMTLDGPACLQVDDVLIASGPVGRHGVAIMNAREQLGFEPPPRSDCGNLFPAVDTLCSVTVPRAMRDCTRGGVAAVLHEWAAASSLTMAIDHVPVLPETSSVCELLGIDPLHSACEGTMLVAAPPDQVDSCLAALRNIPISMGAAVIGRVTRSEGEGVLVRRALGGFVPLDEPWGAMLPRIC